MWIILCQWHINRSLPFIKFGASDSWSKASDPMSFERISIYFDWTQLAFSDTLQYLISSFLFPPPLQWLLPLETGWLCATSTHVFLTPTTLLLLPNNHVFFSKFEVHILSVTSRISPREPQFFGIFSMLMTLLLMLPCNISYGTSATSV